MEKQVLEAFLYNNRLKFTEIEKALKIRSNKLSYHLKNLIKNKTLEKEGEYYKLTEDSEKLIPYISEKKGVLGIILVAIKKNNNQVYLYHRKKRPFYNKLSLPGGRMILGESIKEATKRIAKKFGINAEFIKVNSANLEHVNRGKKILHTYFQFLVSAKTNEELEYTKIKQNKDEIISSDYTFLTKDLNKEVNIREVFTDP